MAMALFIGVVALLLAGLSLAGPEAKGRQMTEGAS
jgi:hypothetical protein